MKKLVSVLFAIALFGLLTDTAEARTKRYPSAGKPAAGKSFAKNKHTLGDIRRAATRGLKKAVRKVVDNPWRRIDTHASMIRQNLKANEAKLRRYSDAELLAARDSDELVPIPNTRYVRVNPELNQKWRADWKKKGVAANAVHFWVRDYILERSEVCAHTGAVWYLTSVTRSRERQKWVIDHHPKNHAGTVEEGDFQSTHMAAIAADIRSWNLSAAQESCMLGVFKEDLLNGRIEIIPEKCCFHLVVLPPKPMWEESPKAPTMAFAEE